jgi:simple sugar transport system permease protein
MTKQFKVLYKVSIIILAILAAMTIGSIILMTIGADVVKTYRVILFEPLKTTLQLSEVLLRAIPLTIIALGISVAYRSGIINIGAEGQMAMGILGTTAVALAFPELPKPVLLPMAILAGAISGGVWGFIPGFLKAKLQVSELLSTVMLNYIAAQFYTFLLRGPMLDPAELTMGSGTPQSMRLSRNLWLDRFLPGTRLHTGLFFALILALLIYLLLWKTSYGYKMRAAGASSRAAKYGGINVTWYLVIAMVISGAFAGMAGAIEIAGVHRRAIEGLPAATVSRASS